MTTISRTTYYFTVLHRTDGPPRTLEEALEEADSGQMVGNLTGEGTEEVEDDDVEDELKLLGNDGTFFDNDLNDGEASEST